MKLFPHFHFWRRYIKRSLDNVFFCRDCRCGKTQVRKRDFTWIDDDEKNWTYDWEYRIYLKAVREPITT